MGVERRTGSVVARGVRRGPYRTRSVESKRAIVQQCLAPGASVAGIAVAHGVNPNLVRKWINKYRAGEFGGTAQAPMLLPVTLPETTVTATGPSPLPLTGHLEIELPTGRVRVHGSVDVEVLRVVLESLRG